MQLLYKTIVHISKSFSKQLIMQHNKANKLLGQKSPYLLQHCYNPVNWYPWGDEAFQKAKGLNIPIFLSVGYSTCHWCHVMEHESFQNNEIAELLNKNFVSIKVDREERPDVDYLYMSFIEAITGNGGWPMSIFLTPNLEPFTGGTYFPPMNFINILKMISKEWRENETIILQQGSSISRAIQQQSRPIAVADLPGIELLSKIVVNLSSQFDQKNGGFGNAPKFPKPVEQDFLLHFYWHNKTTKEGKKSLKMVEETLNNMARGGIHDHIGKGFHRYSVDESWRLPHFEKMLYDQAQLLQLYANFLKISGQNLDIVLDIVEYLDTRLSHPEGGFYCAEDADSLPTVNSTEKSEGAFYCWKKNEVEEVLCNKRANSVPNLSLSDLFCEAFNIMDSGNIPSELVKSYTVLSFQKLAVFAYAYELLEAWVQDYRNELNGMNVLRLIDNEAFKQLSSKCEISVDQLNHCLEEAKKHLAEHRSVRPPPHIDSKFLTSWNALAISGLCAASKISKTCLTEERRKAFENRAIKAVEFIKKHLVSSNNELLRSVYTDANDCVVQLDEPIKAFSDDYAFLIQALLDLYEIGFDESLLIWASELQNDMDRLFWNSETNCGYSLSRLTDSSMFTMKQPDHDGVEPCANSVAILNLLRFAAFFDSNSFFERAQNCLRGAAIRLNEWPHALSRMCLSLYFFNDSVPEIIVVGRRESEDTKQMLDEIQARFLPRKVLIFLDTIGGNLLANNNSRFLHMVEESRAENSSIVYICRNCACSLPIKSLKELKESLDKL